MTEQAHTPPLTRTHARTVLCTAPRALQELSRVDPNSPTLDAARDELIARVRAHVARFHGWSPEDVEDVANDTLVLVLGRADTFDPARASCPCRWTDTVLRHAAHEYWRAKTPGIASAFKLCGKARRALGDALAGTYQRPALDALPKTLCRSWESLYLGAPDEDPSLHAFLRALRAAPLAHDLKQALAPLLARLLATMDTARRRGAARTYGDTPVDRLPATPDDLPAAFGRLEQMYNSLPEEGRRLVDHYAEAPELLEAYLAAHADAPWMAAVRDALLAANDDDTLERDDDRE